MFSLICAWTKGWANNRDADDLRCPCARYDVTVMQSRGHRKLKLTQWLPILPSEPLWAIFTKKRHRMSRMPQRKALSIIKSLYSLFNIVVAWLELSSFLCPALKHWTADSWVVAIVTQTPALIWQIWLPDASLGMNCGMKISGRPLWERNNH